MEQELKNLLKKQKEERLKLKEEMILKSFITKKTKIPFKIYMGGISKYGYFGSIKFKDLFREDNLNKTELNELLEAFKPYKMFLCGGNSFRPIEDLKESCIKVNPYILEYRGLTNYNDKINVRWFSEINKKVYEIEAYISNRDFINEIAQRTYDRTEFKGGFKIENTQLHLNGNFSGGDYKVIKWATGTNENPNDFTIYTENLNIDFKEYLNI